MIVLKKKGSDTLIEWSSGIRLFGNFSFRASGRVSYDDGIICMRRQYDNRNDNTNR